MKELAEKDKSPLLVSWIREVLGSIGACKIEPFISPDGGKATGDRLTVDLVVWLSMWTAPGRSYYSRLGGRKVLRSDGR